MYLHIVTFYRGKPMVVQQLQTETKMFWPCVAYSGRSSPVKPLCSKTELNRCTTTEIRQNKNEDARTYLGVSTRICLPNSFKN